VAAGTGLADGGRAVRVGSGTGSASSSLPASLSPGGSAAPGGSATGVAVALGTGDAALVRDGTGTGVATGPPDAVGVTVGVTDPPEGTGTGVADGDGDVAAPTGAGLAWARPVAAIAAVPPPMIASPVTAAITQARLTRGRLLLESMCFSRIRLVRWFVGGKYGRGRGRLRRQGRNLPGCSAVYARAGETDKRGLRWLMVTRSSLSSLRRATPACGMPRTC
jgi:hypothetical protein